MQEIIENKTIEKQNSLQQTKFFFIKQRLNFVRIDKDDIIFIKANGNTTEIQLENHNYILATNLSTTLKKIKCNNIVQVNRSYAINIDYIQSFNNNSIKVNHGVDTVKIPLTRKYKQDFMNKINIITTK